MSRLYLTSLASDAEIFIQRVGSENIFIPEDRSLGNWAVFLCYGCYHDGSLMIQRSSDKLIAMLKYSGLSLFRSVASNQRSLREEMGAGFDF
jgi:hypothetical protein